MRTAVSVPDAIFESADALAARLGVSRSELYARAVEEFVAKHASAKITDRLDAVYAPRLGRVDEGVKRAQARATRFTEW